MGKKISSEDRKKLVSKIGQMPVEKKKKKLKHHPKFKKQVDEDELVLNGKDSCCKKQIVPSKLSDQNGVKVPQDKRSKKIRIIPPEPIRVGKPVL